MEKGGTVPIQILLNTFVSTTHGDKQDRQAAAGRHTAASERCYKKNHSVVRMFFLLIEERGKGGCHN